MKKKLSEIATVQMGHSFRSRLEPDKRGNIAVIQMKDISEDNQLEAKDVIRIEDEKIKPNHFVKQGDIVFRSRGYINTSAIIQEDVEYTVIAAPLLRIRTENNNILSKYLNWFINQPAAQNYLISHAKGTSVRMISKKTLDEMEVFVPPISRQKKIVALAELAEKEQTLLKQLASKRRQFIARILMQTAQDPGIEPG